MEVGGQGQAPAALPPGTKPGTHCTGEWVAFGAGLVSMDKSRFHRSSNTGPRP